VTDPVARDRPRTEAGKRLAAQTLPGMAAIIVAIEDEAAGVLLPDNVYEDPARWGERFEPDTLAKVRAEVEGLMPTYPYTGSTVRRRALTEVLERLAALEAASGTPEPPAASIASIRSYVCTCSTMTGAAIYHGPDCAYPGLREALERIVLVAEGAPGPLLANYRAEVLNIARAALAETPVARDSVLPPDVPSTRQGCEAESSFGRCILARGHAGTHIDAERTEFSYRSSRPTASGLPWRDQSREIVEDAAAAGVTPDGDPLDAAWKAVEVELPEGWVIRGLSHGSPNDEREWVAGAGTVPFWESRTRVRGYGPTPAAALRALILALAETPEPAHPRSCSSWFASDATTGEGICDCGLVDP